MVSFEAPNDTEEPAVTAQVRFNCVELIRFPITISGEEKSLNVAIDTESRHSRISKESARRYKRVEVGDKRADGTDASREFVQVPPLSIGRIPVNPVGPFVVQDLSATSSDFDQPLDGYLGMDILKDLVLSVDMENERAVLANSVSVKDISDYQSVAIVYVQGLPTVRVTIAELGVTQVILGFGSVNGVVLAEPIVAKLHSRNAFVYSDHLDSSTIPRSDRLWILGRVSTIELGEITMKNLCVTANDYHPGLVGMMYLRRYQIIADFPRKVLYLKANSRTNEPDNSDLFGMWLAPADGGLVVTRVTKMSAAARAGIQVNDVLDAVDGVKVDRMTYNAAYPRIAFSKGPMLRLAVRRQQDIKQFEIPTKQAKQ